MPERRVWIDGHKRCIVDGKPFFPLGLFSGKVSEKMLAQYVEGPFNVVMPYARATREDLDLLGAKGLKGFVSLRSELLGTAWAKRNNVTRQEQVDEYFISEIDKVKDHPAQLHSVRWRQGIPDRTDRAHQSSLEPAPGSHESRARTQRRLRY